MVGEVLRLLLPALEHGGVVVDGTLGSGGHAAAVLAAAPSASLIGIDRDPVALEAARPRLERHRDRVRLVRGEFSDLEAVLERCGAPAVRGVLLDLGVSSPQLDDPRRGFSYRAAGPLDMRMDPGAGRSAEVVVNGYPEPELARVISTYGEERYARRVARAIVRARPIRDTEQLADVVARAIPGPSRRTPIHPARRTFQAIRIEVNDELDQLRAALPMVVDALEPGGRAAVLSYHSLEDRAVKRFFAAEARGCVCPPELAICTCRAQVRLRVLTRRPVRPTEEEVRANPRASAAKLRAAERVEPMAERPPELVERKSA